MTDIPKFRKDTLLAESRDLLTATQAVRLGIATHAERHTAAMRSQRARLEEQRKIDRATKPMP